MSKFLPTTGGNSSDSTVTPIEVVRRDFRFAMKQVLQTPEGEVVTERYKCNGMHTGHKVGDDIEYVREMCDCAQDGLKLMLLTDRLTTYQKSQILNGLLRKEWELDKRNKILKDESGNMVPKLRLEHKED